MLKVVSSLGISSKNIIEEKMNDYCMDYVPLLLPFVTMLFYFPEKTLKQLDQTNCLLKISKIHLARGMSNYLLGRFLS